MKAAKRGRWRKAKEIALTIGKLVALEPALGPVVQLLSRSLQYVLAEAVEEGGWKSSLPVPWEAVEPLQVLAQELENFNGHSIRSVATARSVQDILGPVVSKSPDPVYYPPRTSVSAIIAGDASDRATCAYAIEGTPFYMR